MEKDTHESSLLLFDLSVGGHHPSYILYLIQDWKRKIDSGQFTGQFQLRIVVTPEFLTKHTDVTQFVEDHHLKTVQFIAITPQEVNRLQTYKPGISGAIRAFKEWSLFCKYAKLYKASQALLMYFDTLQVPFIFGQRSPCPISGIYFRPTFHYSSFNRPLSRGIKDYIQVFRERFNLTFFLRRSHLKRLFCLDPFVVNYINQHWRVDKARYLADPVQLYDHHKTEFLDTLKSELGIDHDRQVFLMFGALTQRKGLDQVLDAIALLPADVSPKICLLMVGPLGSGSADKDRLKSRISTLSQTSSVQIILRDQFITDQAVQPYFQIADFVLATYQKHVGMSNILVRAALAQKVVISSDYGLMGEITQKFKLGLAIDSGNPLEIARAFQRCTVTPQEEMGDPVSMKQFGEKNLAENFSSVILKGLLGS